MSKVKVYPAEGFGAHIRSVEELADAVFNLETNPSYYVETSRYLDNTTQVGPPLDTITNVKLGVGGTDPEGIFSVDSQGVITILKSGPLMVKQTFELAKRSNPGNVEAFFTAQASTDGGTTWNTLGSSVNRRVANANTINVFFDIAPIFVTQGTLLRNIWCQSSVGGDPGDPTVGVEDSDLIYSAPSAALAALGIQPAPSARAVFYKLVGYNYG